MSLIRKIKGVFGGNKQASPQINPDNIFINSNESIIEDNNETNFSNNPMNNIMYGNVTLSGIENNNDIIFLSEISYEDHIPGQEVQRDEELQELISEKAEKIYDTIDKEVNQDYHNAVSTLDGPKNFGNEWNYITDNLITNEETSEKSEENHEDNPDVDNDIINELKYINIATLNNNHQNKITKSGGKLKMPDVKKKSSKESLLKTPQITPNGQINKTNADKLFDEYLSRGEKEILDKEKQKEKESLDKIKDYIIKSEKPNKDNLLDNFDLTNSINDIRIKDKLKTEADKKVEVELVNIIEELKNKPSKYYITTTDYKIYQYYSDMKKKAGKTKLYPMIVPRSDSSLDFIGFVEMDTRSKFEPLVLDIKVARDVSDIPFLYGLILEQLFATFGKFRIDYKLAKDLKLITVLSQVLKCQLHGGAFYFGYLSNAIIYRVKVDKYPDLKINYKDDSGTEGVFLPNRNREKPNINQKSNTMAFELKSRKLKQDKNIADTRLDIIE